MRRRRWWKPPVCNATLLESWGDKMAEVLVQEAEAEHAELIVMGTHGFSGLGCIC